MPTKLTQLRYSGYSAEFLDRVEPNGNIPSKSGGGSGNNAGEILIEQSWIYFLFAIPILASSKNRPYLIILH